MKFSSNGIGKKNGFRFEIEISRYLDGKPMEDMYYIYCSRPTLNNKYNEQTSTERTIRFRTWEDAEAFCEKVADGEVTLAQLKAAEERAYQERFENQWQQGRELVDAFMVRLEKLGVDPRVVPEVVREYQKMRDALVYKIDQADLFSERLIQLESQPKRKKKTLADHMELTKKDIDVILDDKDTGEHLLPCICYVPEHRRNDPEIGYDDWENWVRSLPLKRLTEVNGTQVAIVKTDFSLDQTCFLIGENEFVSDKWIDLYKRSVWAGAEFKDRLEFLNTGKSFEKPFNGICMDALDPAERSMIFELLEGRSEVFIATYPKDESQYYVYSYQFGKDGRPVYDFNQEISIKLTEPGQGLTSTLEGKIRWARHAGNKAQAETSKEAEKTNSVNKEVKSHDR